VKGFILQRIDDGAYVAKYGIRSYTRTIEKAHIWTRKEYAEAEKCGNERVVAVEDILQSTD
jgi:hypothetical protein